MRIKLVKITRGERGYKGTWYKTGERHFVQQDPKWPLVMSARWHALTPGVWGGINESDCRVISGLGAGIACLWFRLTVRDASWLPRAV